MLVYRVTAVVLVGCCWLTRIDAAAAQSTQAEQVHMACLVAKDVVQRVEACTASIESTNLPKTLRADALAIRASIFLQNGHFDQARSDLIAAQQLETDRSQAIRDMLAKLDEIEAAAETPAVQQRIEFFRCQSEAELALRRNACDAIVAASLGEPTKEAAARALRAAAEVAQEDFDGAQQDIEDAINLDPGRPFYRELKARIGYFRGDYGTALAEYRRLEYESSDASRFPTIAALEYLAGDRKRAIDFFRSAHDVAAPGNVFSFYAAMVQSDLQNGDIAPFRELNFGVAEGDFAGALLAYRLGKIGADELLADAKRTPVQRSQALCMAQFNIGHSLMLGERSEEAKQPFTSAIDLCAKTTFEYHAARKWWKQLAP